MLHASVETRLLRALTRRADTRTFPLVVAAVAMATTLSMTIPFGTLIVAAVLLAPRRWRGIAMASSIGAAIGALVLYLVFHHLGWNRFFAAYPDLVRSSAWRDATSWLGGWGVPSLMVIAALPVPLTPALMFAAVSRLPVAEVILALWAGKLVKYTLYAWLASAFPSPWIRRVQERMATLHAALSRAQAQTRCPGSDPEHRAAPGTSFSGSTDRRKS